MFSLKTNIRRTISVALAAALATTIFTGCSTNTTINDDTSSNSSIVDTIGGYDKDFGMMFKYWYDGEIAQKTQQLASTVTDAVTMTGKYFLDLEDFPIRTDKSGNEYIVSGRKQIYLADGKMAAKDISSLRNSEGYLYYSPHILPEDAQTLADSFNAKLLAEGKTQPQSIEDRITTGSKLDSIKDGTDYNVLVNNIATNALYKKQEMLCISAIIGLYSTDGYVSDTDTLYITTACGPMNIRFTEEASGYTLDYTTGEKFSNVPSTEVELRDNEVYMTLAAVEEYLGYQIEVYDDFINIITDNKNILNADSTLPGNFMASASSSLDIYDTSKPLTPESTESTESTNSDTNSSSNSEPTSSSSDSTTESKPEENTSSGTNSSTNSEPTSTPQSSSSSTSKPSSSSSNSSTSKPTSSGSFTGDGDKPSSSTDTPAGNPKPTYTPSKGVREGDWIWREATGEWWYDPDHNYGTPEEAAAQKELDDKIFNGQHRLGEGEDLSGLEDLFGL